MASTKKFLDVTGLTHLLQKFQDYPNNEILQAVINAIDQAKADRSELFSGSYNDLTNKPSIPSVPANVSAFNNDAGYLTSHQDISGKVNGTYTIQVSNSAPAAGTSNSVITLVV